MIAAFVIHESDTVATLLHEAKEGAQITLRGASSAPSIQAVQVIHEGHKVALCEIPEGEVVIKYGAVIGVAKRPIHRGEWIHLHNCRSLFDERSGTLDVETGGATDVVYE